MTLQIGIFSISCCYLYFCSPLILLNGPFQRLRNWNFDIPEAKPLIPIWRLIRFNIRVVIVTNVFYWWKLIKLSWITNWGKIFTRIIGSQKWRLNPISRINTFRRNLTQIITASNIWRISNIFVIYSILINWSHIKYPLLTILSYFTILWDLLLGLMIIYLLL